MSRQATSVGDLSLNAWQEARRRMRFIRSQLRCSAVSVGVLAGFLAYTVYVPATPRLVWNTSASAPIGLYFIRPKTRVLRGDTVIARVPQAMRKLAAWRHYLPENVPLVKRVAATPGDKICGIGPAIFVNGRRVVTRLRVDARGRSMPWWHGCKTLRQREFFLLMDGHTASFDGRYFGITSASDILGTARLLWTY
ncbi:S26 family signal peptidase [Sphingomonas sp. LaA6.9]|uniref:S26 family signal peptidase n=1 Tax=Sphingomonas sp. LaA6.9 TaxID=2919914 RepID=UPI001F503928|nr:S26 family signal peptidase [Sphingomonas sp. LaA6.9]MCJ8159712.1 S26 family signal peptidase [Sphingomonas sp. LaA6.9]